MSVETKFISADNNWDEEVTVYWFKLKGLDSSTGYEFYDETYGIAESEDGSTEVDEDGAPLTEGDNVTIAVRNNLSVTDEIRAEAAGQ